MWPFSRRRKEFTTEQHAAMRQVRAEPHKGTLLDRCANDVDRRSLCLQWAGEARNAYYEGRRQSIEDMILSEDRRYRHMSMATREKIGEMKWSKSLMAKELQGLEQMYSRWAVQYAGGPGSK